MKGSVALDVVAAAAASVLGFVCVLMLAAGDAGPQIAGSQINGDAQIRAAFRRPSALPVAPSKPMTAEIVALGERLFSDKRLSGNGRISCATCHDLKLGLADGTRLSSAGATARPLGRHTPTLWNVAWVPQLMWDGRAVGLEQQAALPMSHPDEMASSPAESVARVAKDPEMVRLFEAAFPEAPAMVADNLVAALAAFQRTLVSPPTRFDAWVAGDAAALSVEERLGLSLFVGKAGCANCHTGFAFTDTAFHDIGLPTTDLGRGPVSGIPALVHAFKTPTLRELSWTAPYMHDGSIATLEDVVRHYESGGIARPTRSKEMRASLNLSDEERNALIAFLEALSSDTPPRPSSEPWVRIRQSVPHAPVPKAVNTISQKDRAFSPSAVRLKRGETITILNDDMRAHNVRIVGPDLDFNSGVQEPGESIALKLDRTGLFKAHCSIHPTMELSITVE